MWQVTLETRNFTFEAFGETEKEAGDTLTLALQKHADQYRLPRDWWYDFKRDIVSRNLLPRTAYRGPEIILCRA